MNQDAVHFHRVLRCPPERIYRAFVDPVAFARWLPPFGYTGQVHAQELRVGGAWRMSFTHFASGQSHSFGGHYLELVPGERIAYDASFDDPQWPGRMTTRVELRAVSCGCEMRITQDGIPPMIPTEMCYLGWQESLVALAQLVEHAPGA